MFTVDKQEEFNRILNTVQNHNMTLSHVATAIEILGEIFDSKSPDGTINWLKEKVTDENTYIPTCIAVIKHICTLYNLTNIECAKILLDLAPSISIEKKETTLGYALHKAKLGIHKQTP